MTLNSYMDIKGSSGEVPEEGKTCNCKLEERGYFLYNSRKQ